MLTFEIDLNMLRGDRVRGHIDFVLDPSGYLRQPEQGELVEVVDEDGARYLAVVEAVSASGFVDLVVKLDTRVRVDVRLEPLAGSGLAGDVALKSYTSSPALPATDLSFAS